MTRINLLRRPHPLVRAGRLVTLLFLAVFLACGGETTGPTRATAPARDVIDGIEVAEGEFPAVFGFATRLQEGSGPSAVTIDGRCTGFLVHPSLILTAAHCVRSASVWSATNALAMPGPVTAPARTARVSRAEAHPDYQNPVPELGCIAQVRLAETDIGFLRLSEPIADVAPIPIFSAPRPDANLCFGGAETTLVGYGATEWRADGKYEFVRSGRKMRGTNRITHAGRGHFFLGDAAHGALPGDSGGPVLATVDGKTSVIGLNHAMCSGSREEKYRNRRGKEKTRTVPAYGGTLVTVLTPTLLCWAEKESGIDLDGVDCRADGTPVPPAAPPADDVSCPTIPSAAEAEPTSAS